MWLDPNSSGGSEFESTSSSQEKTPWPFCPLEAFCCLAPGSSVPLPRPGLTPCSPSFLPTGRHRMLWLQVRVLTLSPRMQRSSYSTRVAQMTDLRVRRSPLSSQIPWWHAQTKKTFKSFLLLSILLLFWILLALCIVSYCHVQLCDPMESARLLCPWGFSRREYWSGYPFSFPEDLPNPGIKRMSSTLQADSWPSEPPGKISTCWSLAVCQAVV